MEVIEHDLRLGKVLGNSLLVGRRHVHRDCLDLGVRAPDTLPERPQRVCALPLADEDHVTGVKVQDQRQVLVAFAHRDLVDGDLRQVFQLGLGEPSGKVTFDDVLDQIPTHVKVLGDVLDGHEAGQFQCVTFEGLGIASALIGEPNLDLSDQTTGLAVDARNLEVNDHGFASDGGGSKRSLGSTTWVYGRRTGSRATQRFFALVEGKVDGSSN